MCLIPAVFYMFLLHETVTSNNHQQSVLCPGWFRMTPRSELSDARQVPSGQQHPALNLSHSSSIQDSTHQLVHRVPEESKDIKDNNC